MPKVPLVNQPERIEGRVAAILNAKELVINVGSKNGVEPGQIFAVLAGTPVEVKDPETGEILDTIDREKVRVKAKEVRERVAICSTYRRIPGVNFGSVMGIDIARMMREPTDETLQITDNSTPPPLTEEESFVKVNDRVILIPDKE